MFAFIVRRVIGMIFVLIAVSFLVFVIFIVVPGGDPATRIAGKSARPSRQPAPAGRRPPVSVRGPGAAAAARRPG